MPPCVSGDGQLILRDAEVGHDGAVGAALDHDVLRLHVAVDHAPGVGVGQGPGSLAQHPDRLGRRERAAGAQSLGEVFAVDEAHGEEGHPVDFVGPVDRHDVGMGELGRGARLAEEPLAQFGIRRQRRGGGP